MPDRITVLSPAKLNLILRVLGQRPDGYHELSMLNIAVDLYDRVRISQAGGDGVKIICDHPGVPAGPTNLAARAAEAFFTAFPTARTGLTIEIEKRVPVAGGLGGGSGNAAAVLWGLPRLLGAPVPPGRLLELAVEIGSDVPFFLYQSPAWAGGRGEILSPAEGELPGAIVIVSFPFGLSTAEVFRGWDDARNDLTSSYDSSRVVHPRGLALMPPPWEWVNDLEQVALLRHREIGSVRDSLLKLGAKAARMSGSGPTVFGVFSDETSALRAQKTVGLSRGATALWGRPLRGAVLKETS